MLSIAACCVSPLVIILPSLKLRRVAPLMSQAMSDGPHVDKVHCLVPNGAGIDVDNVNRICHMSYLLSPVYQMIKWRKF